jgi:DNA polymerase-3 subunit alpha
VNKKVLESLIKAGACDTICVDGRDGYLAWRARLIAGLDRILDHGNRYQRDQEQGQSLLFGDEPGGAAGDDASLPAARAWTDTEALAYEKEALGLYMSGHPLLRFAETLARAGAKRPAELTGPEGDCAIAGIVTGLRPLKTKRGDRMAVFMLEDDVAKVETVVFPEAFAKYGSLVSDDAMLVVRGKYERDDETSRLVAAEITLLDTVRERAIREVEIRLSGSVARQMMRDLNDILERHPGDRRVSFVVEVAGRSALRVRAATARRITPSDRFVRDVEALCGAGAVHMRQ